MTGGAPVPSTLLARIRALMGPDTVVLTGYGLTEATALATLEEVELTADGQIARPKSIGRPLDGIELRIVGEDGRESPVGEVGEIQLRGPMVMKGYRDAPVDTAQAITPQGWLRTGDLGLIGADGHVRLVDRIKDIIIRGGQNIYPADVRECLYRAQGVAEACVVGAPDETLGETPVAFVAISPGAELTASGLMAHCKAELAHYNVPTAVHFLAELPKGPTGKILARGLRARLTEAPDAERNR